MTISKDDHAKSQIGQDADIQRPTSASSQKGPAIRLSERGDTIPFMQRPTCSIREACKAVGLGRTKLYELIAAGKIKTICVGRRRLIQIASLLRYLQADDQPL